MRHWSLLLIPLLVFGACVLSAVLYAQQQTKLVAPKYSTLPTTCSVGDLVTKTSATAGLYVCSAANTFTLVTSGTTYTVGVAAGYKIARGSTALDGSNPTTVATGLTTVVSCAGTLLRNSAVTSGTAFLTHDTASSANVDWFGWILAGTASTGTETFEWICVGT